MKQSDLIRKMESCAFLTHNPDGEEMWVVPLATVKKCVTQLEVKLEIYENREKGMEKCEGCSEWYEAERMQLTADGVWLCPRDALLPDSDPLVPKKQRYVTRLVPREVVWQYVGKEIEMIKLGDKVKDKISGFEGIATATGKYLNGCTRILIEPTKLDEDGKMLKAVWFDDVQIEVAEKGAFAEGKKKVGGPARSDSRRSNPS